MDISKTIFSFASTNFYPIVFMVDTLVLLRDDILLALPPETEQRTRTQASGIEVATLQSQTYNPVYGTILQFGPECKHAQLYDRAFFQVFTFSVAKERAYGDETNSQFANEYSPTQHFAFKDDDGRWYMIIRESALYFLLVPDRMSTPVSLAINDPEFFMLNNYVLASPAIESKFDGSHITIHAIDEQGQIAPVLTLRGGRDWDSPLLLTVSNKDYSLNEAIIFQAPQGCGLNPGDHVQTLRFCDITLEEQYNNPALPDNYFIIEFKNIISKRMEDKSYQAGHKRVIVKPDEIASETASGIINLESARAKLLTGKVLSVGPECSGWQTGDAVLYARNSGMPIPHEDGDLLVLADIDVFAKIVN